MRVTFLLLFIFSGVAGTSHGEPSLPSLMVNSISRVSTALNLHLSSSHRFLIAAILCFPAAGISSASGLGGGALFIPILTLISGVDLKTAVSYSACMVTTGAVSSVACQIIMNRKNPLIDVDIALLSEPFMLLGVSVGVICNAVFPVWLITVLLATFLFFTTWKTILSGVRLWKQESRSRGGEGTVEIETFETDQPPAVGSGRKWIKLAGLPIIWLSFFAVYLFRGNRYGNGIFHLKPCGTVYWILSTSQILLAVVFTALNMSISSWRQENRRTTRGGESLNPIVFPVAALFAGVIGGLFGVGGGLIMNPVLLQIGVPPQVTVATSSLMILLTSSMTAFQYLISGVKDVRRAVICSAISFFASLIGFVLIKRVVKKYGRESILVLLIGFVVALSVVFITVSQVIAVVRSRADGETLGFKKLC